MKSIPSKKSKKVVDGHLCMELNFSGKIFRLNKLNRFYCIIIEKSNIRELYLFGKFLSEEFTPDELAFFLFAYENLFEGLLPQPPSSADDYYILLPVQSLKFFSFLTTINYFCFEFCRRCISIVFEGATEKKMKSFFSDFEGFIISIYYYKFKGFIEEGKDVDAFIFLSFLMDFYVFLTVINFFFNKFNYIS
jgi:hypothetical protein